MKTKIILIAFVSLILIAAYPFKSADSETQVATLGYHLGKSNDNNFIIMYGDGTSEKIPITLRLGNESLLERQQKVTMIMAQMKKKGFHLVSAYDSFYFLKNNAASVKNPFFSTISFG